MFFETAQINSLKQGTFGVSVPVDQDGKDDSREEGQDRDDNGRYGQCGYLGLASFERVFLKCYGHGFCRLMGRFGYVVIFCAVPVVSEGVRDGHCGVGFFIG